MEDAHLIAILEVLKSGYWYDKKVRRVLNPFDISHEQYNILRILEHNHPRKFSLKEIQSRLMNQTANTTRLVEKLKQKGFIVSAYSKINRRTLQIGITKSGLGIMNQIRTPILDMGNKFNKVLSEKEAVDLINLLRKFRSAG